MARSSRGYKSEKRRKELNRKKKQEEKRLKSRKNVKGSSQDAEIKESPE